MLERLQKEKAHIARKVHELRRERRWTQAELARHLDLSQGRLSEIERGDGSFTAEQFLTILRLFNVTASDFTTTAADPHSDLQNALARIGALQLQESTDVLPSERLGDVSAVIREVIVASELPRQITALAPVLVTNVDRLHLERLFAQLADAGLERRLGWVVENTLEAIRRELPGLPAKTAWRRPYNRAQVVLSAFLEFVGPAPDRHRVPDVLDGGIRSKRTLEEVRAASSAISKRWGIVTVLQPEDFGEALRGARGDRR